MPKDSCRPNIVFLFPDQFRADFAGANGADWLQTPNIDSIAEIPGPMWVEIFLLNGVLSFTAAYYFRKYGFLAAVGIHFWNNVVWHVIWGAL